MALGDFKSASPVGLEAGLGVKLAPIWRPLDWKKSMWTIKESLLSYSRAEQTRLEGLEWKKTKLLNSLNSRPGQLG